MPTPDGKLGVAVCGVGWCASQHIAAFLHNPHTAVTWLCARDADRARANLAKYGIALPGARITTSYEDVLAASDVDIVSIATPNHLHAEQAVAAARAGKHLLLEKPTGLDVAELVRIRDAVRRAGVRTIVSFELRYNPFLKFARWLRTEGWLGEIRFARTQYLSQVTDWYSGWAWVRTRESGRSHLLAAGCHAVDALRWCSGLEPVVGERASHADHRGLRMADVDCREHDARRLRPRPRDQLHRLHDALHVPGGADGRSGDAAAGPAAVARHADRPRAAGGGEPVSGRSRLRRRPTRSAGRRSASSARCPTRPT